MIINKDIIDCILYTQFEEEDYDSDVGICKSLYTISNLFDREEFARYAIEKILRAYSEVMFGKA